MILAPAAIPSPTQSVWFLGPLPIRAYALCILVGILIAIRMGERRWMERGGRAGTVLDIAAWAVPFGILGGRLYHVLTTWQPYFGPDGDPVAALYVWEGGLGIWGAVALGGVGAWIGARRAGVLLPPMADALAPGVVLAQAVGRWGNWFNNELYGGPTSLPWGLTIHEWDQSAGHALPSAADAAVKGVFHPTFLYESVWDVGIAVVVLLADRRFRLGHGRVFALYVLLYCVGRSWIEALRIDPANHVLGLRLNLWTCLIVGLGALAYLVISTKLRPGREVTVFRPVAPARPPLADGSDTPDAAADPAAALAADDSTDRADDAGEGHEPGAVGADKGRSGGRNRDTKGPSDSVQ